MANRDPKPLVHELADSLAAFSFMPCRGLPTPPRQRYRETAVFRWFLSLGHAAKCATLTIHSRCVRVCVCVCVCVCRIFPRLLNSL